MSVPVRVYSHQEMISFWSERDPPVDPDLFGTLFSPVCRPPTPLEDFQDRALGLYNGFRSRNPKKDQQDKPKSTSSDENAASQQSPLGRDKTSRKWTAPKFAAPKVITQSEVTPQPQSGFAPQPQSGFAPQLQSGFAPQPLDHSEEQEARRKAEEEARRKAEEEARKRIEEERRQAEQAKREAEEAKRQAEQARREAEEARQKAEEERRKAEEERRRIEEERRQIEEERRRMEEKARSMRAKQTSFAEIERQQELEAARHKQNLRQEKPETVAWGGRQHVNAVSIADAVKTNDRPSNPPEPQQPRSKKGKGKAIVLSLEDFAREARKPTAWEDVGDSKPRTTPSFADILEQDEPPPKPSSSKKKGKFKKGQSMPLQEFLAANEEPTAPQRKAQAPAPPSFSAIMAQESEPASQPKKEPAPQNSRSSKKKGKKVSMSLQEFLQESNPKPSEPPQPVRAQPKKVTSFSSIMEEDEVKEAVQPRSRKKGKQKKVVYDLNDFIRAPQWQTVDSDDSDDEPRRPVKGKRAVPSMAEILAADEAEERARKQRERSGPTSASFQGVAKKAGKSFAELMKEDEDTVDVITTGVIQDFVPGHRYELPERKAAPVKPADAEDLFWGAATQEEVQRNQRSRTNDPAGFLCKLIEEATGETDMYEFAVSLIGKSQRDMVNSINTVTSTRSEAVSIVDRFLRKYPAQRR